MEKSRKKILILFAHPVQHKSRVNTRLLESVRDIEDITLHNLYETYPDFHIDVQREQELLLAHDIIIWQHPFYWYSAPSLVKEWIDLVLEHGWAYGRTGDALEGKQVISAISSGGRRETYQAGGFNAYTIRQLLAPFERTVVLCRMEYLPPFVVHGTHLMSEEDIGRAALDYRTLLISLRDDIFSSDEIHGCEYLNDILALKKRN